MTQCLSWSAFVFVLLISTPLPAQAGNGDGGEVQLLVLPSGLPDAFQVSVRVDGMPRTLWLQRRSLRAPGFELLESRDGTCSRVDPLPESVTYFGGVLEEPGALVAMSLLEEGLSGLIALEDGESWFVRPLSGGPLALPRALHRVAQEVQEMSNDCCAASDSLVPPGGVGGFTGAFTTSQGGGSSSATGNCTKLAEVAFDADYEFYLQNGSSVTQTVQNIESAMAEVAVPYMRDALVTYTITATIVRTSGFYTSSDAFALLDEFRNEWNTNQAGIPRDMAHLISGKNLGYILGLAYVGVVCNLPWAYGLSVGLSGGYSGIVAHELGHNWNCPHCVDPSCDIMCGICEMKFGTENSRIIVAWRDAIAGCLDDDATVLPPVGPCAFHDSVTTNAPLLIDVLGNDLDANCDFLLIDSFDPVSAYGGTVELSVGTGPGGRDQLLYSPPTTWHAPLDTFNYTAGDGFGGQDAAIVRVADTHPSLVAHYKLNDLQGAGNRCVDSSPYLHHGTYEGNVTKGEPGARPETGNAVRFDGVDGRVTIPDNSIFDQLRSNVSVATWVNPDQLTGVQRVFSNPGAWGFGLTTTGLRFTTYGIKDYNFSTSIPVGTWTHLAATFNSEYDVRFYVNGAPIGVITGSSPANFPAPTWSIATRDAGEFFDGLLDDVQIYDSKLTEKQVKYLYDHPGSTVCPSEWLLYGSGLAGTLGVPTIEVDGNPKVGGSFDVIVGNSRGALTLGFMFVGLAKASLPLLGGTLLVSPLFVVALPIPSPSTTWTFTVPDGLPCGNAYLQIMETDPGGPQGYSFTQGLEIHVGA